MTLYEKLQNHCPTEEDVKDAYIAALKLKGYQKNLIDIQTKEIWFEAKVGGKNSTYAMFTQLLFYVATALKNGEYIPPFLCVIDSVKAAIMKTETVLPFLEDKSLKIKWGKSASDVTQDALDKVSQFIGTHFVSFNIATHEKEFLEAVKSAIATGKIIRTQITPDNLKQVFDKWVDMVGKEIGGVSDEDYALLFFADVMSDGTVSTHDDLTAQLVHKGNKPAFFLNGKLYEIGSAEGYRRFWAIYDRPPKEEYRNYLLERRDSLIPLDERQFKGAYYTPLHVVDKAYDLLERVLGAHWQRDYIVWDMCCGVGNLESKHSNPRRIFMSTLDAADVDVMKAAKICTSAERFQYDYLNDDITDDGEIDYTLTNKIPQALQDAIQMSREGKKKILVLINPPYAEAANADNRSNETNDKSAENKKNVSHTKIGKLTENIGFAKRELFAQFLMRIAKEIPTATVAMFSKLKYVNAPNFEDFRKVWNAKYLDGFIVHSKAFDGLKGDFPIGFCIWQTANSGACSAVDSKETLKQVQGDIVASHAELVSASTEKKHTDLFAANAAHSDKKAKGVSPDQIRVLNKKTPITEIQCEVLDKDAQPIGAKTFYNLPSEQFLNNWIKRPKANDEDAVPLKNAITPTTSTKDVRGKKWSDGAIGCLVCKGNDLQNAGQGTFLLSSGYCSAGGMFVNAENLWKVAVVFTVHRIVQHTWINDRDQFLQPCKELSDEFKNDCLIWMLFNGSNLTAGADGLEWNGKTWSLTNHFIPFTETEVGAPSRFESDFMTEYLSSKGLKSLATHSPEAKAVLDAGREIWKAFFRADIPHTVRTKYKLGRADAGWYQIRMSLKDLNASGNAVPVSFAAFEEAYKTLTEKLRPQVYSYGFLR